MPHAVMAFFDVTTEAAIRAIWRELDDTGSAPYLNRSANRPHFKLGIYENLNVPAAGQRLLEIAKDTPRLPVNFKSIGIFPNSQPTVFVSPAVTPNLLALQERACSALAGIGNSPPFDFFLSGHWVPHCLLGFDLDPAVLNSVLNCAFHLQLPFEGKIEEIGLVEFHPVIHICTYRLADN